MLPVVALLSDRRVIDPHPFHVVGEKYIDAVRHGAGALPLLIPALADDLQSSRLLEVIDGVVLTDSVTNILTSYYDGGEPYSGSPTDPARDATVQALVPVIIAAGIPLLGICRSIQELNVALGGTLHQQVHATAGLADHREDKAAGLEVQYGPAHDVTLMEGGRLAALYPARQVRVHSLHGQGIARPADRLAVEATASDGLIEAVRVKDAATFALTVQWHPEWRWREQPFYRALWQAFGDACRAHAAAKSPAVFETNRNECATDKLRDWIRERRITEIEALVPDMTGNARGKIIPADRCFSEGGARLPEAIFIQTVTGDWPDDDVLEGIVDPADIDIFLEADPDTVRMVPWVEEPTAQIIHDCVDSGGNAHPPAPRTVLKNVLAVYAQDGLRPIVAPELEFYLVKRNTDTDQPLQPPVGRSGRQERARQSCA